jgi:hypothetical protein
MAGELGIKWNLMGLPLSDQTREARTPLSAFSRFIIGNPKVLSCEIRINAIGDAAPQNSSRRTSLGLTV